MQTLAELPFVGGHVALDFVNTAEQRGHPAAGDVLHSADDLRAWGERYGLLSAGVSGDGAELRRAVEARELLYSVLLARAGGGRRRTASWSGSPRWRWPPVVRDAWSPVPTTGSAGAGTRAACPPSATPS